MIDFKELREQISDEMMLAKLAEFDIFPVKEDATQIVFPTFCHNLDGGSNKLHYYKNNRLFRCYTECEGMFDIFTFIQKIWALRGRDISVGEAIEFCGLEFSGKTNNAENPYGYAQAQDLRYMQTLNNRVSAGELLKINHYEEKILRNFSFDYMGLESWIREGISVSSLQKFNIKYDGFRHGIIIPNFDIEGKLIGIRVRHLKESDLKYGKYRPLKHQEITYSHPTGSMFYGIYENKENIQRTGTAIIFEGEKSVLLYGTIYGEENNIALASLGQNISKMHIEQLRQLGVSKVIIAYDTDYEDYKVMYEIEQKTRKKAQLLSPYFNVCFLIDDQMELPYKSSPIEGGKECFEKILRNKRWVS